MSDKDAGRGRAATTVGQPRSLPAHPLSQRRWICWRQRMLLVIADRSVSSGTDLVTVTVAGGGGQ